ncbi:MAG: LuxR C-terminal-related transcriptional regulator [Dehalococcoidia bacterium]|nr:LuxR C-terminal-related transcriptional regulator [Dehalococcoidia bacterium]
MTTRDVNQPRARLEWLEVLSASSPLYAVDLDQRITYWDARATRDLAAPADALGRHCYEVLASLDPRNARRCRPNCQVVAMARAGRAAPDFDVWGPVRGDASRQMRVSILLGSGARPEDTSVIHLVRCEDGATASEGDLCAVLAGDGSQPTPASASEARPDLTARQIDVLRLLSQGRSTSEIASALGVRTVTVRNHAQAAMDRLGARTRLEAVILAARTGLL